MINVALSGSLDGGITPGLTVFAGPSKHFKTGFALLMAQSFLAKYPDGIILFYDSEFGTPQAYFKSYGIPFDSVVHTPITNIEELKFDIMQQLDNLGRGDHIMIVMDSIGNLASKKEVEDARDQKSVADMTRAKALKSLFRIVTPHFTLKDIPCVVVNHTYKEQGMYPREIMSGGTGPYLSADNIWILGRQQDKDGQEIQGYNFIINVEKSRYVKEKSKIPISISYEWGINRWSGLLELALEGKYIEKPKAGWYAVVNQTTGELVEPNMRASDFVDNGAFWKKLLAETNFADFIQQKYFLGDNNILREEEQ